MFCEVIKFIWHKKTNTRHQVKPFKIQKCLKSLNKIYLSNKLGWVNILDNNLVPINKFVDNSCTVINLVSRWEKDYLITLGDDKKLKLLHHVRNCRYSRTAV